jgi:NAD(P)H-nitrite reductase large subunit
MNILIIGNSAASTAAIEAIRSHDQQCSIVQLSDEAQPLYSRCLLSYYLSDSIGWETLLYRENDFHEKMNVQLHAGIGSRAVELDTARQQVTCADGKIFDYDRLLIATGASSKLPSHIPANIEGIFVLRNLEDVEKIKKSLQNAKNVVVYGGGLIGIKAAAALGTLGLKTTVVVRSDRVLSQMIDQDAGRVVAGQLKENNIDVLYGTDISEVRTVDGRLTGIKINQGKVIDCDLLIVAKGVTPNTEFAKTSGIEIDWGIKTNSFMQTDDENVFAAGDVAEAFDIVLETHTVNALWTCAVQQGRIAGLNMIDRNAAYSGAVGMNSLNIFNLSLMSFGITAPKEGHNFRTLILNRPERNLYKKIIIDSHNHVKGIILVGKTSNAGVLLSLIQRKSDVSSFEDELLSDRFNFGTLLKYSGGAELETYYRGRSI